LVLLKRRFAGVEMTFLRINDRNQLERVKKGVDKAHQRPKSVGTREKGR
jgi:hypothetical protein